MDLAQRPVDLAIELVRAGARVVVVGGVARRLRGAPHRPRDLDVVVGAADVPGLVVALRALGVHPVPARLLRSGCSRLETSYGPLDVFVGRPPPAEVLTGIAVAATA